MRKYIITICSTGLIFIISCTSHIEVKNESFKINEGTSWHIDLPVDWKRLSDSEIKELEGTGQESLEETIGAEIVPNHCSLFIIQKDEFNSIMATTQFYDSTFATYEEEQNYLFEIVLQAYDHEGMTYDFVMGTDTIGGFVFKTMSIDIFAESNKRDLIMNQLIWDRLFDDYSLMITANSNNDVDKKTMIDWVKNSKFSN